jgi:hypothetical protein
VTNKELYALAYDGAIARLTKTNNQITELRKAINAPGGPDGEDHYVFLRPDTILTQMAEVKTATAKHKDGKKRRGGMTDEGRARIAEAQRKRWAKVRKEQSNAKKAQGKTKAAVAKKGK